MSFRNRKRFYVLHSACFVFFSTFCFLNVACAGAQQCPDEPLPEIPAQFRFNNISAPGEGIIHNIGTESYVRLVDEFSSKMPDRKPSSEIPWIADIISLPNVTKVVIESKYRATFLMNDPVFGLLMVAKWLYSKDGGAVCPQPGTINASVLGSPAIVALAESPVQSDEKPCLWTIEIDVGKQVEYDIWIKDFCHKGKPKFSKEQILKKVSEIVSGTS